MFDEKDSPLLPQRFTGNITPQKYYPLTSFVYEAQSELPEDRNSPDQQQVRRIIKELDDKGRWLCKNVNKSNPYIGDGTKTAMTGEYDSTRVGDETDTSPYRDESNQDYISTEVFINNMRVLLDYIAAR